jgi:hypothetical protein
VIPGLLRELRIYGGAQGIWVDKERTQHLTDVGSGVTVGLLHTGSSYPDDLSEDGAIYHYPKTTRTGRRDHSEIEATKAAGQLGIPLFVVTYPSPSSNHRNVEMGWVEDWDDESGQFLISFGDHQPTAMDETDFDTKPFQLEEPASKKKREIAARAGQQRFCFLVFRRYGPRCAVCGLQVRELLDAAHIRPKKKRGSDDPRNGLVLCSLHHRAFDAGLFAIEPESLTIVCSDDGPSASVLRIDLPSLQHLARKPHREALVWQWERWQRG